MSKQSIINKNRIEWIDLAKGFAILFVILGHILEQFYSSGGIIKIVYIAIYSFHMPLFIALSGMVFKSEKYPSVLVLIKKKAKTLIIPSYCFIPIKIIIELLNGNKLKINIKTIVRTLLQFRVDILAQYWFLPTLFCIFIIVWFIHKYFKRDLYRILISTAVSIVGAVYYIYIKKALPFCLDNAMLLTVFFEMGYQLYKRIITLSNKMTTFWSCLFIWVIGAYVNYNFFGKTPVSLANATILNPALFFIVAFSGLMVIVLICYCLTSIRLINLFGRNSLVIYLIGGLIIIPFTSLLHHISNNKIILMIACVIIALVTTFISAIISIFINRFLPFLVGKSYDKRKTKSGHM